MDILTALFLSVSIYYQLPPQLLSSVCYVETKHDAQAIHIDDGSSDSLGVCQLKLATAQGLGFKGTAQELMLPKNNILYAGKYLAYQIKRHNGNTTKAIISYNRGNAKGLTRTEYSDRVIKQWEVAFNEYRNAR